MVIDTMKIKVYNQTAEFVHDLEVSEKIFGVKSNPELFIPSKKVVSFHVFQKLTTFDLAYYVLRL